MKLVVNYDYVKIYEDVKVEDVEAIKEDLKLVLVYEHYGSKVFKKIKAKGFKNVEEYVENRNIEEFEDIKDVKKYIEDAKIRELFLFDDKDFVLNCYLNE